VAHQTSVATSIQATLPTLASYAAHPLGETGGTRFGTPRDQGLPLVPLRWILPAKADDLANGAAVEPANLAF